MSRIIKPNQSSLSWEVQTERLYNGNGQALKDYKLLTRSDSGALLNVCKKSYNPTLNSRFKEIVQRMAKVTGFEFSGYVEAFGGKKVFAYLKSNGEKIAGFDFDNYMVIGNSHDYSSGFFIASVHEMLRCQNQWAKVKKGALYTISHTSSSEYRVEELILRFDNYMEDLRKSKRRLELWRQIDVSPELREVTIRRVLDLELGDIESLPKKSKSRYDALDFALQREVKDVGENVLGLFQGVTYYTTHMLSQKTNVFGNVLGNAYELNERAFSFCGEIEDEAEGRVKLVLN